MEGRVPEVGGASVKTRTPYLGYGELDVPEIGSKIRWPKKRSRSTLGAFVGSFWKHCGIILVSIFDAVLRHAFGINFGLCWTSFQKPEPLIFIAGVIKITFSKERKKSLKLS